MKKDIDKPSCAICHKQPAKEKLLVEGELAEHYCKLHAAEMREFLTVGDFRRQL